MGNKAYSRNLRVAGNVAPGSIQRWAPTRSSRCWNRDTP
jgi:hypothetical protein